MTIRIKVIITKADSAVLYDEANQPVIANINPSKIPSAYLPNDIVSFTLSNLAIKQLYNKKINNTYLT